MQPEVMQPEVKKKGFTIVELVIVIAVIAILASVLIPTFSGIIEKANQSSDIQLVKNLNTAVQIELNSQGITNGRYATAYDAVVACANNGYLVDTIVARSSMDIAWNRTTGKFVLVNTDTGEIVYPTGDGVETLSALGDEVNYFLFRSVMPAADTEEAKYSIFASSGWKTETVALDAVGFDAGSSTGIKTVSYINNADDAAEQNVIIRTNSFETTVKVDAPKDTADHYGYAAIVNIVQINSASYHEYGTVGRLYVQKGHAVVEEDSVVVCLMDKDGEAGKVATTNIASGAKVVHDATSETSETSFTAENAQYNSETQRNDYGENENDGTVKDCGAGHHTYGEKIFVDSSHIYEVCSCCGYTLVSIEDNNGLIVKQTANTIVDGEVTEEKTTPVMTYEYDSVLPTNIPAFTNYTTGDVLIETPEISGKTDEEGNVIAPVSVTCDHNFVYSDHGHDGDDEDDHYCLGICTKCGTTIKRAHDYIVETQIPGVYEYSSICSRCSCERYNYVANVGNLGTSYVTLPAAFQAIHTAAAAAGATTDNPYKVLIKLVANEKFDVHSYALTVNANEDITLDLNGFRLSGYSDEAKTNALILNNGTLLLKDSSDTDKDGTGTGSMTFDSSATDTNSTPTYASNLITNRGTLTIESGYYYNSSSDGYAAFTIDNYANGNDAYLTINGGKILSAKAMSIRQVPYATTQNNVTINSGVIGSYWIQNGGTSSASAVGTLTINGGEFLKTVRFDTGWSQDYSWIHGNNISVIITDGQFNSTNFLVYSGYDDETFSISGGSFKKDVSDYCEDGYFVRLEAEYYTVLPESQATDEEVVAKIGAIKYLSIDKAIAAAKSGDTITLNKAISADSIYVNGKSNITIDLNDKTVTSNWGFVIKNNSVVTIKNGTVNGKYCAFNPCGGGNSLTLESITATASTKYSTVYPAYEGSYDVGAAISFDDKNDTVTILSGVYSGVNTSFWNYESNTVIIQGGTFDFEEWNAGSTHYGPVSYTGYSAPYNTFEGYRDYLISVGYSNVIDKGNGTVEFDYIWEAGNVISYLTVVNGYSASISQDRKTFTVTAN